jgi:glycolate oxidase
MSDAILEELAGIVGSTYVSGHPEEKFIYSRDPGTMDPCDPDYVVMPGTVEEVQKIVRLANREGIPVVPLGAGLVLSGLSRPLKGGMVLDMKRMNRILEVNEKSRYALVEAGTSQGMLQAYLARHHPSLKHSMPDSPPMATIAGNTLIHGIGHLSLNGFHSDMLNGLEVVIPTGEIVKIGSCSASPYWFARSPLPDLAGLFVGWAGTTGVATKLAIKLYPKRSHSDVSIFVVEDPELVPDILLGLTGVQMAEDIFAWMTPEPAWARGLVHINVQYSADSPEELGWKWKLIRASTKKYIRDRTGGFMVLPPGMKKRFLQEPQSDLVQMADVKKGGGFEYVGAIMPVEVFPQAYVVGLAHCMMFFYAYPFNRADPEDMKQAQEALEETNQAALDLGGIPWKAEAPAQKQIIKMMDANTFTLMNRIRGVMDPKGIMNPGNWELE